MLLIRSYNPFFCLTVILITFNLKSQSQRDCAGDKQKPKDGLKCCTHFHVVNGYCEACKAGYFGTSCARSCHYPSFGLRCEGNCTCSKSECDFTIGCRKKESTTVILSTTSTVYVDTYTTKSKAVTISSKMPDSTPIKSEKEMTDENNSNDNKFVVAISVTVSSSALIVLALLLTKLRSNNKENVVYYIQNPDTNTPEPHRNQFSVPFRNLETDIYLEIQELDEIDERSNTSCGTIPDPERESTHKTNDENS